MAVQSNGPQGPDSSGNGRFYGGFLALIGAVLVAVGIDGYPNPAWWLAAALGLMAIVSGLWIAGFFEFLRRRR